MFSRFAAVFLFAASFAFAAPAFSDGTGKAPVYNAPAPLTPQQHTGFVTTPTTTHHSQTYCHSSCGSSGPHYSNSGLPTNPRPVCCGQTYAPAPVYHAPAPVVQAPIQPVYTQTSGGLTLDGATIASMSGGVGTCLLYTSPSPRDQRGARMPSSA